MCFLSTHSALGRPSIFFGCLLHGLKAVLERQYASRDLANVITAIGGKVPRWQAFVLTRGRKR